MFMGLFLSAFSAVAPLADSISARDNRTVAVVCFIEAAFQRSRPAPAGASQTKGMNLAVHCSETARQKHRRTGFFEQKNRGGQWPAPAGTSSAGLAGLGNEVVGDLQGTVHVAG